MTSKQDAALISAVIADDAESVKLLLESGAAADCCEDAAQLQPLHFAALYDSAKVIPLLIMAGADVTAYTDCEDTPLSIAKRHGNQAVIQALSRYALTAGRA
jgi:ankyrin repeat protein